MLTRCGDTIQALESIVERCPQHARNFLEPIFSIALEFLSYDPNYEADMEEDEDEDEDMDDEECETLFPSPPEL